MCGKMNAALMAHKKLARHLKRCGYEMNPYDPCVWNKMVLIKQLTLLFHVDDVLMNHESTRVITDHVKFLDQECGSNDPLTVTRGKVHECLGVTLNFRWKGSVAFT